MWGEKRNVWKFAAIYLKDEVLHTRVQFVLEISRQMPLFDEFGSNSLRHTLDGRELGLQVATPLHSISEISEGLANLNGARNPVRSLQASQIFGGAIRDIF